MVKTVQTLLHGDCLALMEKLPDACVDMVMCDLPYGTTACKWDTRIDLTEMWKQYKRICKPTAAIVLTAAQPFTSVLVCSNLRDFKYQWVWNKVFSANYAQAKYAPMRIHEDVVVFGASSAYHPIMIKRDKPIKKGANKGAEFVGGKGLHRKDYAGKVYTEKCPVSIVEFSSRADKRGFHPTQKPVALMEYMVRTYTHEGMTVLDNCMGSGTTGVACVNLNRSFIGIEKDAEHFKTAERRINASTKRLFC